MDNSETQKIAQMKKRIGENIRRIRLQHQVEVKQLCSDLEISPSAYSNIERGVTDINISRVMQLADYFSVHYAQILAIDNTTIFQFTPHSSHTSTQHNINHQAAISHNEGFDMAFRQAQSESQYLREQNNRLLELLAKNK
jgi:transcriptional regulator with XRE-family HTH domain